MSNDKIYAGSGKTILGRFGEFYKVSICLSDIPKEHTFEYNGKTYIKLEISKKKEVDMYGKNVTVAVDTWKPDGEKQAAAPAADVFESGGSGLPF